MKYFGYGIDLSNLHFKNLNLFIHHYDPNLYTDMQRDLEDSGLELDDESIIDYLDNYENGYGYYGLSAYLSDIINENEKLELCCYDSCVNGCIYVPAQYPWQFSDKMKKMKKEKINEIMKLYFSQITDDEIKCEDLVMYVDCMD